MMPWSSYKRGIISEFLASIFLRLKGYRILDTRFKCGQGEIDLIVRKSKLLVFVEVKARGSQKKALESVLYRQRRRIEQAALFYLSKNDIKDYHSMRFDIITFNKWLMPKHLKSAWIQGD